MYDLPIWFLVTSLFVPRVAMFVEWHWYHSPFPFEQPFKGLAWLCVPRLLILIMIHSNQGFSKWFWVHLVVAFFALFFGGSAAKSRNSH